MIDAEELTAEGSVTIRASDWTDILRDSPASASFDVIARLRKTRYARISRYQDEHGLRGRRGFCRSLSITRVTMMAIVRDDHRQFSDDERCRVLTALSVSPEEWDTP